MAPPANDLDKLGSDISSSEDELLTGEPVVKLTYSPALRPPGVGSSDNDDKVMGPFLLVLSFMHWNYFCLID